MRARSRVYTQTVTSEVTQRAGREELNYTVQRGGSTPLLFAARVGDAESARILLEAGADVNDALPDGTSALVEAAHSGQQAVGVAAARQGRGPERRRGRLHGAPCGGAEKRSRPGEGAAGARRESERADHPGHSGPAQQRGLRAARDARRRDALSAGRQVPRGRHHARPGGGRRRSAAGDEDRARHR